MLDLDGFEIVPKVISPALRDELVSRVTHLPLSRSLLEEPWCRKLAAFLRISPLAPLLPDSLVAVQCTYFDKSENSNWFVAYHQDLTIPVMQRIASRECIAWTTKNGTAFVQPPLPVLEALVSVRIHLDENNHENGPLRVIPGSHRHGRLARNGMLPGQRGRAEMICLAPERSALVFKPLLLHASSKSRTAQPRRILHLLYGPRTLPEGLQWIDFV
jgi:ectoine hydroxylase-related dioxygenase (phytanoyl-CoA dioxygenase family)